MPEATKRMTAGMATGKLAVWWIIGSEVVIFGGLLGSYIMYRLLHDQWAAEAAHTNEVAGIINTCVLLTSSLSAVLAHNAAERGDKWKAFKYLWLTILGAMMFMVVKSIEWYGEISNGLTMFRSVFWSFYYIATGLHGLHVIAGAVIMAILSIDVARGKNLHRVELIGLYWHFVDIVWIFLFPLMYIAK